MRTPYGKDCKYFYGDYVRGRETNECRLIENNLVIEDNRKSEPWAPQLCQTCPVPDILRANQCEHLRLYARVGKALFGLSKKVEVEAFCTQYFTDVQDPRVGCGHCHEVNLEEFKVVET